MDLFLVETLSYTISSMVLHGKEVFWRHQDGDYEEWVGEKIRLIGISDVAPIAYAHYRVIPEAMLDNAIKKLPKWMLELSESFDEYCLGM